MTAEGRLQHPAELQPASLSGYALGFISAVILTVIAFGLVATRLLPATVTVGVVVTLAVIQLLVHLVFFLHLARPTEGRLRLYVFVAMVGVVLVLVFGSLWIMDNLNTRMTPSQQRQYMNNQGGM